MTSKSKFKCEFCGKEFVRERALFSHLCEYKRRWRQKNERHVRLAFNSWLAWHKSVRSTRTKHEYEDFMRSQEYVDFIKFGKHVENTNLVNPSQFIDFVVRNDLKLKDWTKDSVFEWYAKQVTRKEDVQVALERFVKLAEKWAEENEKEWTDFFVKVNIYQAYRWITTGRISPWVLYGSKTATNLFERMDSGQLDKLNNFLEPAFWKIKMKKQRDDTKFVTEILGKYEI